ncbi:MAG: NDP-sugar synthase [Desulfatiglandaceae bacterium]
MKKGDAMKGMILAAGYGTRLEPLTSYLPKPLVPVGNRPVIDRLIDYLKQYTIEEIVVNAHYHRDRITTHLDGGRPFGVKIQVRAEPDILGTGGGIKNTQDFWGDKSFVVINGDILTDIDLSQAYELHQRRANLVTLILHDYARFNQVRVDSKMNIMDINATPGPGKLAFTGIHIMEPGLLSRIPAGVFSNIIDCYRNLIKEGAQIQGFFSEGHYWRDIGTLDHYLLANREAAGRQAFLIGGDCDISASARLKDWAVIGPECILAREVEIVRSVLWARVRVKPGVKILDSVVTAEKEVSADVIRGVI